MITAKTRRLHWWEKPMRRFRVYRPAPPEEYREKGAANAPDEVQFEGVVFSDGRVAVRWLTQFRSLSVWDCLEDLEKIHGHPEYGTVWEWLDEEGNLMRIYLAGPMRNFPLFNFPAFDKAAAELREQGHDVFSPADHERDNGFDESKPLEENSYTLRDAMLADLTYIITQAQAVVVLPDWESSRGAVAEVHTAFCIGVPVYEWVDFRRGIEDEVTFNA